MLREVAVLALLRTRAVKNTVPLSVATVVYEYVIVACAFEASVSVAGLGVGEFSVTVPVLVAAGGLATEIMPLCDALELFLTVITRLNGLPELTMLTGKPVAGSVV